MVFPLVVLFYKGICCQFIIIDQGFLSLESFYAKINLTNIWEMKKWVQWQKGVKYDSKTIFVVIEGCGHLDTLNPRCMDDNTECPGVNPESAQKIGP